MEDDIMKNVDNYEEHTQIEVCETGLALYESGKVANVEKIDDFSFSGDVFAEDGTYKVDLRFGTAAGMAIINNCSFCRCQMMNCEHKLALLLAVRDKYFLGAKASLEPPKLFGAKETEALLEAAALRLKARAASPLELAKNAAPSEEPLDVALAFSMLMKRTVKEKRKISMQDINPGTGIMAISAMGDREFWKGNLFLAADLQSIALDTLDSAQSLAWRHKDYASREKGKIIEKLEAIAREAGPVEGKRMMEVFSDLVAQAMHQDTILGVSKVARHFCHDLATRDSFLELLDSRSAMFESPEMKEAKLAIALCANESGVSKFFEKSRRDNYYKLKHVDYLVSKGELGKALELCESGDGSFAWAEKTCEVLEKMGDSGSLRKERERIAFDLDVTDDEYFCNFDKMKPLYSSEEWKYIEEGLVREMKGKKFSYETCSARYVRYLKRKGSVDALYMICFYQPNLFDDLYDVLRSAYKKETQFLLEKFMLWKAQFDGNDVRCKEICALLEKYHGNGLEVSSVIAKLLEKHSRRKTLVRVLSDLKRGLDMRAAQSEPKNASINAR
jgi:hypothetical protein